MIGAAADGAREDAMMLAALIVRPDFAPALAALSEQLGLALQRMTRPLSFEHVKGYAGHRSSVVH